MSLRILTVLAATAALSLAACADSTDDETELTGDGTTLEEQEGGDGLGSSADGRWPAYNTVESIVDASCGTAMVAQFVATEAVGVTEPATDYVFEAEGESIRFTELCGTVVSGETATGVSCRAFDFAEAGTTWFIAYVDLGTRLHLIDAYTDGDTGVRSAFGPTLSTDSLAGWMDEFERLADDLSDCSNSR